MRFLLFEHNSKLANSLKEKYGQHTIIDCVSDVDDCLFLLKIQAYQLLIVNLELNGSQNLAVITQARDQHATCPILGIGQRKLSPSPAQILNCGADDYLAQPFSWAELNARICALLRRSLGNANNDIRAGYFNYQLYSQQISFHHQLLILKRKQQLILECLIFHHPHIVSKEILTTFAWEKDWVSSNNIESHISQLRKNLAQQLKFNPIQTCHGLGYKLAAYQPTQISDLVLWGGRDWEKELNDE